MPERPSLAATVTPRRRYRVAADLELGAVGSGWSLRRYRHAEVKCGRWGCRSGS